MKLMQDGMAVMGGMPGIGADMAAPPDDGNADGNGAVDDGPHGPAAEQAITTWTEHEHTH